MEIRVKMKNITKRFGDLIANDDINFELRKGELHCLLGENGAGKTTLVNILYGLYQPDEGEIYIDGQKVNIRSPKDAISYGIGMVTQHFSLISRMTALENIMLANIPKNKNIPFLYDLNKAKAELDRLMETTAIKIDSIKEKVRDLSVGEQQRVEILKVLYSGSSILILDEPTASLSPPEVLYLFEALRNLTDQGHSVLIITHKMNECMMCDSLTVLRKGKVALKDKVSNVTPEKVRTAMFEDYPSAKVQKPDCLANSEKVAQAEKRTEELNSILKLVDIYARGYNRASSLKGVSFDVRRGEIFGLAGVAGNGQKELFNVLSGLLYPDRGSIIFKDKDITYCPPSVRRKMGIRIVPDDRKALAMFPALPVEDNVILGYEAEHPFSRNSILNKLNIRQYASKIIDKFNISAKNHSLMQHLSGGNQQKTILGREICRDYKLCIISQPSRGLDIKTTEFLWEQLAIERNSGKAIFVISYDLDEIMLLSDRIGVIFEGEIRVFSKEELDLETIGRFMSEGFGGAVCAR